MIKHKKLKRHYQVYFMRVGFVFLFLLSILFLFACTFSNNKEILSNSEKIKLLDKRIKYVKSVTLNNRKIIHANMEQIRVIRGWFRSLKEKELAKEREQKSLLNRIPKVPLVKTNVSKMIVLESTGGAQKGVTISNSGIAFNKNKYYELYESGLSFFMKGEYDRAKNIFKDITKHDKFGEFYAHTLFWLGDVYMHLKEYDKAIKTLKISLNVEPDKPMSRGGKSDAAMYLLSLIYLNQWHDMRSATYYRTMIKDHFPDSVYLKKLNNILARQSK